MLFPGSLKNCLLGCFILFLHVTLLCYGASQEFTDFVRYRESSSEDNLPQKWELISEGRSLRLRRKVYSFSDMKKAEVNTPQDWIDEIVKEHNRLRDLHGNPPLTLDPELCKTAQFYANYLGQVSEGRTLPVLFRKNWYEVGGNMWATVGRKDVNHISPTFSWYNEERYYLYGNDTYCGMDPTSGRHHVDHFTQMIWKGSSTIGCAKNKNKAKHIIIVCHYQPPGNVRGAYPENIPVPFKAE